ncbi:MAG TPA: hypothetical protein VF834_00670 [Streptosporangiaceae bacterium]
MTAGRTAGDVVTADDVEQAVRLAVTTLWPAIGADWSARAGSLDWDCWETTEHLADDLFAYACQLGPQKPPLDARVPVAWQRMRPAGPANSIFVDREAGPAGLLIVLEACGALLTAIVATKPATIMAHHGYGASDPEGFAAMGVVETLVHTHDIAEGLGIRWEPPSDLCARALHRLFPDAPADAAPWPALLWVTGRTELPGRPRLDRWRWYGAAAGASAPSP